MVSMSGGLNWSDFDVISLQSQGKTRESAEAEFLQVVVSPEESWDLEEVKVSSFLRSR